MLKYRNICDSILFPSPIYNLSTVIPNTIAFDEYFLATPLTKTRLHLGVTQAPQFPLLYLVFTPPKSALLLLFPISFY